MYSKNFFITQEVSNNKFSYHVRDNKRIHVPNLIAGTISDAQIGDQIVFEDFGDDGNLRSCKGLKNFIKTSLNGIPVYIFDNHNHAFAFWHLENFLGTIERGATLVHVDQHKDTREPDSFLSIEESKDPEKVFNYTNTVLNVGNFIPAAQKTGLIKKVINVDSEAAIKNFSLPKGENLILDIDLDFFASELAYISEESKIELIREVVPNAKIITIATSPFFIEQTLALKHLRKIFS